MVTLLEISRQMVLQMKTKKKKKTERSGLPSEASARFGGSRCKMEFVSGRKEKKVNFSPLGKLLTDRDHRMPTIRQKTEIVNTSQYWHIMHACHTQSGLLSGDTEILLKSMLFWPEPRWMAFSVTRVVNALLSSDELYCPLNQSGDAVAGATNAVNTRQSEAVYTPTISPHLPYPRAFCTLPSFARIKRSRWRPVGLNGDCEQSNSNHTTTEGGLPSAVSSLTSGAAAV